MIDQIDRELINLLIQDARQTSEKLAQQIKLSPATIRRRISNLINNNIINIVALPNTDLIGLPLRVIFSLNIAPDKLNTIADILKDCPQVTFVACTTGRFDLFALAWFSSTSSLYDFIENVIAKQNGVLSTETSICLQTKKSIGSPGYDNAYQEYFKEIPDTIFE